MKNARKFTAALLAFFLVFNVTPPMASAIEEETGPTDNGTAWESVSSCTESETLYTAAENESSISVGGESFSTSDSTEQERAGTTWSFPEGTYAFRNYGNTNRWMDIQQNLTTPGAHVQQYAFGSSPADVYSASGLFKITRYENLSYAYIIRLVINPNLTLSITSDGSVVTKEIPANDEDVTVNDVFYITYSTNGCRLRSAANSKYIAANATTASGAAGAPDSFLIGVSYSDLDNQALWVPEGYITLIDEGIYAFKNDGNTNRWMDTQGDSDEAGAHILQYAYGTSPADSFSRGGLFKISRVGDTGRYIIRLMTNNLLTLSVSGSEIITKTISPYDSQVAAADTFHIIYYKDTYMIRPYNSSYVITAKNSTASGSAGAPNSYLTTVAKSSATVRARWEMDKYEGTDRSGANFDHPSPAYAGTSFSFTPTVWSTLIGYNIPHVSVRPGYGNVSTEWDASTLTCTATLHDDSTDYLSVKIYNEAGTDYIDNTLSLTISLLVAEDKYLIKNRALGNYMQLDNNIDFEGDITGEIMELFAFDGEEYQWWQFWHIRDGYYRIELADTYKVITVQTSKENENSLLILDGYTGRPAQKWKITLSSSGNYVFRPMSAVPHDTDWCMRAGDEMLLIEGRNVMHQAYTNDSNYMDEWVLAWIASASSVELEGQKKSNWCWAASARMFAKHFYPSVSYTQNQAVAHVKGSEVNDGGNRNEAQTAINYYVSSVTNDVVLETVIKDYQIYSEENLVNFLNDGYVVYIARSWYSDIDNPNSRYGGHASLIYGYVVMNGKYWFLVNDPLPLNQGKAKIISYEKLCNGFEPYDGEDVDDGVWYASIVIDTEYADDTEPYYFDK